MTSRWRSFVFVVSSGPTHRRPTPHLRRGIACLCWKLPLNTKQTTNRNQKPARSVPEGDLCLSALAACAGASFITECKQPPVAFIDQLIGVNAVVITTIRLRFDGRSTALSKVIKWRNSLAAVTLTYLHCALAAAQCIIIGPVCCFVCLWVCYHDNSKLRASIFTKLGL